MEKLKASFIGVFDCPMNGKKVLVNCLFCKWFGGIVDVGYFDHTVLCKNHVRIIETNEKQTDKKNL